MAGQRVVQGDVHEPLWMSECVYVVRKMTSMCIGCSGTAEGNEWTRRASGSKVLPLGLRSHVYVCVCERERSGLEFQNVSLESQTLIRG